MTPPPPLAAAKGGIDGFLRGGFIAGWACRPGTLARCHVQVLVEDRVVGEALADYFRLDLLQAGMGLGHCGFFARLRHELAPGPHTLRLLVLPEAVDIAAPRSFVMPETEAARAALPPAPRTRPCWRDEDVMNHLRQFDLARQYRELGAERFVDGVYRFVLNRWADDTARVAYPADLDKGTLTAENFFAITLGSAERRAMTTPLPAPFDYRFPFSSYAAESS